MVKEVKPIYQSLQREFAVAEKQYSVAYIEGSDIKAETVARVLHILEYGVALNTYGREWNPFNSVSECIFHYQSERIAAGYSFVMFGIRPTTLALCLSKYFQDKLVIASTDWDYTSLAIFKNGYPAIARKDYEMELRVYSGEDEETFSLDYRILPPSGTCCLYSDVCVAVSRGDCNRMRGLATYVTWQPI